MNMHEDSIKLYCSALKLCDENDLKIIFNNLQLKLRDDSFREQLDRDLLNAMIGFCAHYTSKLENFLENFSSHESILLLECIRCLRNACANCAKNQLILKSYPCFLESLIALLGHLITNTDDIKLTMTRCIIQLLGNCSCVTDGNKSLQSHIWNITIGIYDLLLKLDDKQVNSYTCMLIFNCLRESPERISQFVEDDYFAAIVKAIIRLTARSDSEWGAFIIELLFSNPVFLSKFYLNLSIQERIAVITVLQVLLQSSTHGSSEAVTISTENVSFVISNFDCVWKQLFSMEFDKYDKHVVEMLAAFVNVLCEASSQTKYSSLMQSDTNFLSSCINSLRFLNKLSLEKDNPFSRINKGTKITPLDNSNESFGLKGHIIRLLGNLCYRNTIVQNKIRELDGIPLILEQAMIDDRNPFIMQWTLFAVRNLCEGNENNQNFISQMQLKGIANSNELLEDFGIQCNV